MSQPNRPKPQAWPLLNAATIVALFAAAFLIFNLDETALVLGLVAIPVALCALALFWNRSVGALGVLAASLVFLIIFMVIAAASVGLLFLPAAILMLLALRRSMGVRESAEQSVANPGMIESLPARIQ